jgi:dihydroflavonol-4-reductase
VKVFVTGATGFVGSHLAAALVERGDDVTWTLEDAAGFADALREVDVVYHVAGLTAAPSERAFLEVNAEGTRRLIGAAVVAAPGLQRLVYVSSIAAVGPVPHGTLLTEDTPARPVTAYGRSKLAGEDATRRSQGLPWTIVRPGVVYGPRDRELLRMFRIARYGAVPVFGRGRQEVSLVHVADLVAAILRAGAEPGAVAQTYHIAHPTALSQRELAGAIGRAVNGGRAPLVIPVPAALAAPIVRVIGRAATAAGRRTVVSGDKLAEFLAPSFATSVEKAARELGWRATIESGAGLAATAAWYRGEGWL